MRNDDGKRDQVNNYLTCLVEHEMNRNNETIIRNDDGKRDPISLARNEGNWHGETTIGNDDEMKDQVEGRLT
jgi:hypothetical protein